MKSSYKLAAIVLLAIACKSKKNETTGLPFYNTPDFMPVWVSPADAGYNRIHTISKFSFVNQLGQKITDRNTAGKIYVANFFFTSCPTLCPKTMANLAMVRSAFPNDTTVLILSHSVTPLKDSVPVLRFYGTRNHIDGRTWWLLTGDHDAIYNIARKAYFAEDQSGFAKAPDQFLHSENLILIDRNGHIRGIYNGTLPFEVNRLIRHIRLLQKEGNS